LFKLSITI